jgi:hypothetical protein
VEFARRCRNGFDCYDVKVNHCGQPLGLLLIEDQGQIRIETVLDGEIKRHGIAIAKGDVILGINETPLMTLPQYHIMVHSVQYLVLHFGRPQQLAATLECILSSKHGQAWVLCWSSIPAALRGGCTTTVPSGSRCCLVPCEWPREGSPDFLRVLVGDLLCWARIEDVQVPPRGVDIECAGWELPAPSHGLLRETSAEL